MCAFLCVVFNFFISCSNLTLTLMLFRCATVILLPVISFSHVSVAHAALDYIPHKCILIWPFTAFTFESLILVFQLGFLTVCWSSERDILLFGLWEENDGWYRIVPPVSMESWKIRRIIHYTRTVPRLMSSQNHRPIKICMSGMCNRLNTVWENAHLNCNNRLNPMCHWMARFLIFSEFSRNNRDRLIFSIVNATHLKAFPFSWASNARKKFAEKSHIWFIWVAPDMIHLGCLMKRTMLRVANI